MKLILPGEFVTLNDYINAERSNKYAGASIKKSETERVYWECRQQKLSAVLGKLDYTFTWYVKDRRRDPDNVFFACKFIMDGLYQAGIIESDGQRHVGSIMHNPIEVDKENPRVLVEINQQIKPQTMQAGNRTLAQTLETVAKLEQMVDAIPFAHGSEGTHFVCVQVANADGPTTCCGCTGHKCTDDPKAINVENNEASEVNKLI